MKPIQIKTPWLGKLACAAVLSNALVGCENTKTNNDLAQPASSKPNVILIYADDISARELAIYQSSQWSGKQGKSVSDPSKLADIPVISRIANQGAFVETAWAATICSPSRAMMMTGQYASIHKWWHNKDYGKIKDPLNGRQRISRLYETSPLQIGHIAQQAGYKTIWSGKTQMKHNTDHSVYGFDEGVFTPGVNYPTIAPHTTFGIMQRKQKVNGKPVLYNADTNKDLPFKSYVQQAWYWKPNVQLMNHPDAKTKSEYWPNTPNPLLILGSIHTDQTLS
ncbi:sulfatase-like hydrolase/transferase [Saccharobesus litoralis]|uniref:sulfatase-like hydrolase/transferase n=1 Tax=Saccharobesus litoralis TaxID=2172099 RepID=UPI001900F36D|nr:sulfatase-like hydrolase/transferase [Saccharobesus litoralis]